MSHVFQGIKLRTASLAVVLCLGFSGSVEAAEPAVPSYTAVAPLKAWQEKSKASIEYVGHKYGMDLWMAAHDGNLQLVYTTPDKQGMLLDGMLFGPDGADQTSALQRDFIAQDPVRAEKILQTVSDMRGAIIDNTPPTAAAPATAPIDTTAKKSSGRSVALWRDLTNSAFISFGAKNTVDGTTQPLVYVFADPKCDHCHALWKTLQPKIAAQDLEVRLVPVAVLGAESEKLAAQLLSQTDLLAAWDKVAAGQKMTEPTTDAGKASFATNQKIFMNYHMSSAPTLVYRQHSSNIVRMVLGNPDDINLFFADVGIPPKAVAQTAPAKADKTVE